LRTLLQLCHHLTAAVVLPRVPHQSPDVSTMVVMKSVCRSSVKPCPII